LHGTPILSPPEAGQSLLLCTDFNRIIALDPATGEERWVFDPEVKLKPFGQYKCRGISLWHDDEVPLDQACSWRVYTNTSDRRLFSVDALSGVRCADFGTNGEVDINPLIMEAMPLGDIGGIQLWSPPAVVGDIVAVSSSVHGKGGSATAASGQIRGFDARTGEFKWWFDPVPRNPGDPEAANWPAEALETTGAGNVWGYMSVDEERDLLFLPTSNASPDYYGGTRPGDNRYASSLVALRGATGELVWHYQMIHHDVWNYDPTAQPILATIERNGRPVDVVVELPKSGFAWVFDRETGEPFFGAEEREVPTDGVPGEVLSPTQPFPLAPPPLVPIEISPDDAWGFTLYDQAVCRAEIEKSRHGSIFTPLSLRGSVWYPQPGGGTNWGGGAYDPESNVIITNVSRIPEKIQLIPQSEMDMDAATRPGAGRPGGPPKYIKGTPYGVKLGPLLSPLGAPCTEPPWFTLLALDLDTATVKWEVPLGTIKNCTPFGMNLELGAPGFGGPIVTAGGLVFIGATQDRKFRAFDSESGEFLWEADTPSNAMTIPMTYEIDGRQFVVTVAGGHHFLDGPNVTDHILAFALPAN
jgi:quinoprotein glucose dehydrogenase